jgi:hypothetical protein
MSRQFRASSALMAYLRPVVSGADWAGCFGSASSAADPPLDLCGLTRMIEASPSSRPSALSLMVRRLSLAKPSTRSDFGLRADDADRADGRGPYHLEPPRRTLRSWASASRNASAGLEGAVISIFLRCRKWAGNVALIAYAAGANARVSRPSGQSRGHQME